LPGIPSATTVAREGVDMAALNAKLLEKIEELTLYIILATYDQPAHW
jgi:trimeric autotransporter adhesin